MLVWPDFSPIRDFSLKEPSIKITNNSKQTNRQTKQYTKYVRVQSPPAEPHPLKQSVFKEITKVHFITQNVVLKPFTALAGMYGNCGEVYKILTKFFA